MNLALCISSAFNPVCFLRGAHGLHGAVDCGCRVDGGPNQSNDNDITFRQPPVADACHDTVSGCVVCEAINKDFLSRKRLDQIVPAHARNSQPAGSDDCTNKCNCKKIRFRIASSSFVACCASRCISSAFLFLKINHLRRCPPDQVL